MNTIDILTRLRSLGVKLWVEEGRLRCSAPVGVLSAEMKGELSAHKDDIVALLRSAQIGSQGVARESIMPIPRNGFLPVSSSQRRLWFLDQFEPGSSAYNISGAARLRGRLNVAALEQALGDIVKRHESLRTRIVTHEGEPAAVVEPFREWGLVVTDLSNLPDKERAAAVDRLVAKEARRPFALARGPLFRGRLLRLSGDEYVLLLAVHHIVADGWSLSVILRELCALYESKLTGEAAALPELPIQYADFAHWQQEWLESPELAGQLDYWKERLAGDLPLLELPFDRPRPAIQTFRGRRAVHLFPRKLVDGLNDLARDGGATLFMVLLAGFNALIARWTGQHDIVVGSSSANRRRTELEHLIGFFVNNLVLRTDLSGDPTFLELIERSQDVALGADAHQDVPFEQLVEVLDPRRSLSYPPLFQIMFILQNYEDVELKLSDVTLSPVEQQTETSRYDLTLEIQEKNEGLLVWTEYNTDLFDSSTIERFQEQFERLLTGAVAAPQTRLSGLELLGEAEKETLIHEWNATGREVPAGAGLPELLEGQVDRRPEASAVVFGQERWSYRELDERANRLARYLQKLGVGPETVVGVCLERSAEMVVGLLGILKAGGAYVPMDPAYPRDRLAFMLEDAGVSVLVSEEGCRGGLPETGARFVSVDREREAIAQESSARLDGGPTAEQLAYVIYTSGSTGKPKGVEISHGALVNFLLSMQREPGLEASDRLLALTTICFDISNLELFLPLLVGAELVVASREDTLDGGRLAELIRQRAITALQATPAAWRLLLDAGWSEGAGLKVLCGGEALSRELAERLLATGAEVWNLYGPTETTIWSTVGRVESGTGIVSIGRPIANTEILILDEALQLTPIGVVGELHIGGQGLARGYRHRPELTAERFIADPYSQEAGARLYKTGDRARWRPDGRLECLGRLDQQIKLRGFRIELGEIESVLSSHPMVAEAAAMVREDAPGDQRLAAYWVAREATAKPSVSALRGALEAKLPHYMLPAHFVELERFPLTPNGKVDRKRLPAPETERPQLEAGYESPANALERQLAEIWQEVLKLQRVGVNDNFFDLGGNSLLLVQVQSRIDARLRRNVPLIEFFQRTTVRALANHLGSEKHESGVRQGTLNRIDERVRKQRSALGTELPT